MLAIRVKTPLGFILMLAVLSCWAGTKCDGPYQGRRISARTMQTILNKHSQRLSEEPHKNTVVTNLCGSDISGLNLNSQDLRRMNLALTNMADIRLNGAKLNYSNLHQAFLRKAELNRAKLRHAVLTDAQIVKAQLEQSDLSRAQAAGSVFKYSQLTNADFNFAELTKANFKGADLTQSQFNWATLQDAKLVNIIAPRAQFTHADLSQANLTDAQLARANFTDANLTRAKLPRADLSETTLLRTNLKATQFEPSLKGLPQLISLSRSRNFTALNIKSERALAVMVQLRAQYQKLGLTSMAKTITAMINYQQMASSWHAGGWSRIEAAFNYIFFYLTSNYGKYPARPLIISLLLILVFMVPYRVALGGRHMRRGITVLWYPNLIYQETKPQHVQDDAQLALILRQRKKHGLLAQIREETRLWRIAAYFSVLSAFSIGWRDLNIRTWIHRMQKRSYQLAGQGWVRSLAGLQPVLTAYLIVLAVLAYFGHPFAW